MGTTSITNCSFTQATNKQKEAIDGLIGLGMTPESAWGTYDTSFTELLFKTTPNIPKIVSYWIDRTGTYGEINFGATNTSKFIGSITYLPRKPIAAASPANPNASIPKTADYLWSVGLNTIKIASTTIPMPSNQTAIIATGTSVAFFPKPLLDSVAKGLNATYSAADSRYNLACSNASIRLI